MHYSSSVAVCRHCGKVLDGKPFHMGGDAYHPETKKRCPKNHYGGFVCSHHCDVMACIEQLSSMPGCDGAAHPDCFAMMKIKRNWPNEYI